MKVIVVASVISVLIVLNIMVGGGGIESPWGIECGSVSFWVIHGVMICFLLAAAWAAQTYLIARHEIKNIVRFDYVHGDIRWNRRAGWLYPGESGHADRRVRCWRTSRLTFRTNNCMCQLSFVWQVCWLECLASVEE